MGETKTKVSDFQRRVLALMQAARGGDFSLCNRWVSESHPYRPPEGMYSGSIYYPESYVFPSRLTVPYRTIATLLKQRLIRQSRRFTKTSHYGEISFEATDIYYELTEAGEAVLLEKENGGEEG